MLLTAETTPRATRLQGEGGDRGRAAGARTPHWDPADRAATGRDDVPGGRAAQQRVVRTMPWRIATSRRSSALPLPSPWPNRAATTACAHNACSTWPFCPPCSTGRRRSGSMRMRVSFVLYQDHWRRWARAAEARLFVVALDGLAASGSETPTPRTCCASSRQCPTRGSSRPSWGDYSSEIDDFAKPPIPQTSPRTPAPNLSWDRRSSGIAAGSPSPRQWPPRWSRSVSKCFGQAPCRLPTVLRGM